MSIKTAVAKETEIVKLSVNNVSEFKVTVVPVADLPGALVMATPIVESGLIGRKAAEKILNANSETLYLPDCQKGVYRSGPGRYHPAVILGLTVNGRVSIRLAKSQIEVPISSVYDRAIFDAETGDTYVTGKSWRKRLASTMILRAGE